MQRRTYIGLLALFLLGCDNGREVIIENQRMKMNDAIRIGDDIYSAHEKLIEQGFRIEYGPDFPTKSQKYLMMIVDFGVHPSDMETFRYTVGLEGNDKLIDGLIKADPAGKIYSIE